MENTLWRQRKCVWYPLYPSEYGTERSQAGEVTQANDLYEILYLLSFKSNKELKIIFLSGTENLESARMFLSYIGKIFNRKTNIETTRSDDPQAKNAADIKVIADDSLLDEKKVVDIIVKKIKSGQTGDAFVFFSKVRIRRIVNECVKQLGGRSIGDVDKPRNLSRSHQRELDDAKRRLLYKYQSTSSAGYKKELERIEYELEKKYGDRKSDIHKLLNLPGAQKIQNNHLRNAVSHGIGYIFRQEANDLTPEEKMEGIEPLTETDKTAVQELFKDKKINVLLCTPAIGIGVSISIRDMYIPNLYKPEGMSGGRIDVVRVNKRDMSQLLNRVGRGSYPTSVIYTPEENVDFIKEVLRMSDNLNTFNEVPAIEISGGAKNKATFQRIMHNIFSMGKEYLKYKNEVDLKLRF